MRRLTASILWKTGAGWADASGDTEVESVSVAGIPVPQTVLSEQVYDVVCADGLEPDSRTHRCADNGALVDLSNCRYSANIGASELSTTWSDPDFDPSQRAFYYVRVLENPTSRWTTYRALARGVPIPEPSAIKERAWSSPIWFTPATD